MLGRWWVIGAALLAAGGALLFLGDRSGAAAGVEAQARAAGPIPAGRVAGLAQPAPGQRLAAEGELQTAAAPGLAAVEALPAGALQGVLLAADGSPCAGVRVWLEPGDGDHGGGTSARTDASGSFEVQDLQPGEWLVWAELASPWTSASAYAGSVEIGPGVTAQGGFVLADRELRLDLRVLPADVFADDVEDGGQTGWDLRLVPLGATPGRPVGARVLFGDGAECRDQLLAMLKAAEQSGPQLTGWAARDRALVAAMRAGRLDLDLRGEPVSFPGLHPGVYRCELDVGLVRHPVSGELVPATVERRLDLSEPSTGPVVLTIDWWAEIARARRELAEQASPAGAGDPR